MSISLSGSEADYKNLARRAKSLAQPCRVLPFPEVLLTAVLGYRSQTAYAWILGAPIAGNGYVPLNPAFLISRTKLMLESSACESLIADPSSEAQLARLLSSISRPIAIICPDSTDVAELAASFSNHQVIRATELADADAWSFPHVDDNSVAYLLFTSGRTGQPKGVMVSALSCQGTTANGCG